MKKDSSVFITGATGLLGSYLARLLVQEGFTNITCIRRSDSSDDLLGDAADRVKWITGDMENLDWEEALAGMEYVFHCAALISHDASDRERMFEINVRATANLVNACLRCKVDRLVFISSVAALNRDPDLEHIDPDSTFTRNRLSTDYGWTKHLAEMEVWRGAAEGLEVNVITPSIILGSGKWQDGSTALFKNVWMGIPFYPIGGNGFVDVRDVARLAKAAMETEVKSQRIIANAENLSYRELFSMIASHLSVRAPERPLNDTMALAYVLIRKLRSRLTGMKSIVTRQSVRLAQHRFYYSNDKSKTIFDFKYRPLEETIRETAMQFRDAASENFSQRILPIDF